MIRLENSEDQQTIDIHEPVVIGRSPSCDLVLSSGLVSSRHAALERRDGTWAVKDLASSNGTTVNGRRIKTWQRLAAGDVVRLAGVALEVVQVDGHTTSDHSITHQEGRAKGAPPAPYHLVLTFTGPAEGTITLSTQGQTWTTQAGMPFVLLDLLAQARGEWVDDDELKSRLWGRKGHTMSRSALNTLVYNTRRIFYGWGLDGLCLVKERCRARLAVASVERVEAG